MLQKSPVSLVDSKEHGLTWEDVWGNPEIEETFHSSFYPFKQYLFLTHNTESPKPYHLWSLLSLTAAVASNHCYLSQGMIGRKRLNLGVVLSGRPALKKSSAITLMQRFANSLVLNYGPSDTGGARHGVMAAMQNRWQDDIQDEMESITSLEELANAEFEDIIAKQKRPMTRPSSIYFTAKELGRLLTAQTRELLDFFADGIDGEPIFYQTKNGNIRIPAPLINLLGATTPGSLPHVLPRDSHDHGLLSRLIFVYAARPERSVPIPPHPSERELHAQGVLLETLERIQSYADGEITFDERAVEEYKLLYGYTVPTLEFKLNAYASRRPDHLARIAALICLLRGEAPYVVSREDVGLAHLLLNMTEQSMDGAYASLDRGLDNRIYAVVREILESATEHFGVEDELVLVSTLYRSGFREEEILGALMRLKNSKRLVAHGSKLTLADNIGAAKARTYLDSYKRRSVVR